MYIVSVSNELCMANNEVNMLTLQEAFPMRLKALHVVNEPSIFSILFAIAKPFLKEKTVNRVCIVHILSIFCVSILY